jgi:hypothetical protein
MLKAELEGITMVNGSTGCEILKTQSSKCTVKGGDTSMVVRFLGIQVFMLYLTNDAVLRSECELRLAEDLVPLILASVCTYQSCRRTRATVIGHRDLSQTRNPK